MGLKNRGKKLERKEKSKVKLKGKLLPKGQNETDVSFKVKKIVIREQLKPVNEAEPLSRRKLNVKELLSRLQHHNVNVRQDGLSGLKELVTLCPAEVLVPHLGALMEGVAALILDQESAVRREALKLLRSILTQVTCEQIVPFFDILQSYLSCAMTHIHTVTQEDSLLLLDVLLETTPSLVAENSQKIFPNFLDMISKLRVESQPGRTLTTNLGSKITSVKWRIKVLTRLHGLLAALVASKPTLGAGEPSAAPTYRWDAAKPLFVPLCCENYIKNCELPVLFGNRGIHLETTGEDLQGYMKILMPLLFETWLEVSPATVNKETNIPRNILMPNSAELLGCILEVLQLSWEYLECWERERKLTSLTTWFKSTYSAELCRHLMPGFPYMQMQSVTIKQRKRRSRQEDVPQPELLPKQTCTRQNLALCYLLCCLNDSTQLQMCTDILNCAIDCVRSWETLDEETSSQLTKVLRKILLERSRRWMGQGVQVSRILDNLMVRLPSFGPRLRRHTFELLGDIVLEPSLSDLHKSARFEIWRSELPALLCQSPVSAKTVNVLTTLACHHDQGLLNSFTEKLPEILRQLPTLEVTGAESLEEGRNSVVNLIYWVCDRENVKQVLAEESRHWDHPLRKYVDQLVSLRN